MSTVERLVRPVLTRTQRILIKYTIMGTDKPIMMNNLKQLLSKILDEILDEKLQIVKGEVDEVKTVKVSVHHLELAINEMESYSRKQHYKIYKRS